MLHGADRGLVSTRTTSMIVISSVLDNSAASLGAGRMAILSGKVLLAVGFPAGPGALGLGGRWPDAGAPYRAGRVSAALNRMLIARAATANATAIRMTARRSRSCPEGTCSDAGMSWPLYSLSNTYTIAVRWESDWSRPASMPRSWRCSR